MKKLRIGQKVIYNGDQYQHLQGAVCFIRKAPIEVGDYTIDLPGHPMHLCSSEYLIPLLFEDYYTQLYGILQNK